MNILWNRSEPSLGVILAASAPMYWIISQEARQILAEFLRISEFDLLSPVLCPFFYCHEFSLKCILCFEWPSVRAIRLDNLQATRYPGHAVE